MIEIKELSKIYSSRDRNIEALNNINLSIKKGDFLVIVGESGSGKSTLLHMIAGVERPSSGQVLIDGVDITTLSERESSVFRLRKIGLVFQFFNLIPILTVEENIEMPILLDDGEADEAYINELLHLLGLQDRKNHLPAELSGGQQQRVAIGRALANKPSIILADEPTGNLDSKNAMDVLELLKYSARKYNQTLILITHDEKIAQLADRVITIQKGEIVRDEVLAE